MGSGTACLGVDGDVLAVEQVLAQLGHRRGNENVFEGGIFPEHALTQGGHSIGNLELGAGGGGRVDQKLLLVVVIEHPVLSGEVGVVLVHRDLGQASEGVKGVVDVVNVFQGFGEGNALNSVCGLIIEQLGCQGGGGNVVEGVGDVPVGLTAQVVAHCHAVVIGKGVVAYGLVQAVTEIGLVILAEGVHIVVDGTPGGVHKNPPILHIRHIPGVAAIGGVAVDQDAGNLQVGEHGLGQVGIGLADAFPFNKGGVGVLVFDAVVVVVGDVLVDPILDGNHLFIVTGLVLGDLHSFGTDLLKLRLSDDDVAVSHIGLRGGLLQHGHQLLVGALDVR